MKRYETLRLERAQDDVLIVQLDRPTAMNALNTLMGQELVDFFEDLSLQTGAVRSVVLTGAGDMAFCAGGDLKERKGMSDAAWQAQHLIFERMVRAILNCPIPVICAVNGAAYGGGCEISLCCDFIYAAERARFAQSEVRLGIMPGGGGTQTLARSVGERRAKELILTGRTFTAAEAHEWGMVNKVVSNGALMSEALSAASVIAGNAPLSVRQAKQSIGRGLQMSLADGLAFEIEAYNRLVPSSDRREGVAAFNEKRPPVFEGR